MINITFSYQNINVSLELKKKSLIQFNCQQNLAYIYVQSFTISSKFASS